MTEEDDEQTGDSGLGTGSGGAQYPVRKSQLGIVATYVQLFDWDVSLDAQYSSLCSCN